MGSTTSPPILVRHTGELHELTGPRLLTFADAVEEIGRAADEYAATAAQHGAPGEVVELLTSRFGEVLDGRNARRADPVQRALGGEPRDFANHRRDATATGVFTS